MLLQFYLTLDSVGAWVRGYVHEIVSFADLLIRDWGKKFPT